MRATVRGAAALDAAPAARPRLPRLSAHLGYLFTDVPLRRRLAAAAAAGFDAVEHPSPYDEPVDALRREVADRGLAYVQIALPMGDRAAGDKGIACHPGREAEQREGLERAIAYATALQCRLVHPMSGIVPPGVERSTAMAVYVDRLRRFADELGGRGLGVLVEFINGRDVPGYLIDSPQLALEAIERCGRPNVRMLLDAYHFAVVGSDPVAFLRAHVRRIGHVQIADCPGRHEPGTGAIDFDRLFEALDALGYEGRVGCEYAPAGRTEAGLAWRDRYR